MEIGPSFADLLFKKLSFTIGVSKHTGKSTEAAQVEVLRQIGQVSSSQNGDIISGQGVTKSGEVDGIVE